MMNFQPKTGKGLLLACAILGAIQSEAQYTNYFANQVFSTGTISPSPQGTFNGGTYSVSNPGGASISTWQSQPTGLPTGAAYPASGSTILALNSGGGAGTKTITITPSASFTPADHIYIEDLDNGESATFRFYAPTSGNLMSTTSFRAVAISSNLNSDFSLTNNSTNIAINGGANLQTQPLLEIIPDAPVGYFTITFNNPNSTGSFGFFMGRNKPVLTQTLSTNTITRGRSATLTYTLSGINNNPIYQLGFTNTLPSGWKIYGVPTPTGTHGTFSTPANGSTVSLSGMDNSFSASNGLMSATWTVEVSNADNQMNSSCSGNPAAFSNSLSNYTTSAAVLTNSVTPVCMTITAPLPLELSTFEASATACRTHIRWASAFESQLAAYELQRSTDGTSWTTIARVPAVNRQAPQEYSYSDDRAPQGRLQYRLRILDLSGAAEYSAIAAVSNACDAGAGFSLSPNPAHRAIRLNLGVAPAAESKVELSLLDLAGRVVARVAASDRSGSFATAQLPQLVPGLYVAQVMIDGVAAGTTRLSIQ